MKSFTQTLKLTRAAFNEAPKLSHTQKVQIQHVSMQYVGQQATIALSDVSLEIGAGEFVVVVGPSGCGKSTLLNLIAGFERPKTGSVKMNGIEVDQPGPDRLLMFQEHALFPWLNVSQNIEFGLRHKREISKNERRDRVAALLKMVHLEEFAKARVHELSGGMKHRVALARALAPDPEVLLIDEPFPALDTITRVHLYKELQEIFVLTKKTIISVTHDVREAACLADRIIVMSARPGRVVAELSVNLARPRNFYDPEVAQTAEKISRLLQSPHE